MSTNHDTKTIVRLLERYSEASVQLAEIQAQLDRALITAARAVQADYVQLRTEIERLTDEIERLARSHPEWFASRRTLSTPVGSISLRTTTRIEVPDPEATIRLIQAHMPERYSDLVKTELTLRLDALAQLDDHELARLMVRRVVDESVRITPAKADADKALEQLKTAESKRSVAP